MARYKNVNSGAVVSVRDDKVLDSTWEPLDGGPKGGDATGYDSQKVGDLKAEITRRNANRGDDDAQLSTDGKKADLVATLEADDKAQADTPAAD